MKRITVLLGSSHNDFDRQLKDLMNDMAECMENLSIAQELKGGVKSAPHVCEVCGNKADIITTSLDTHVHRSFCNACLVKTA